MKVEVEDEGGGEEVEGMVRESKGKEEVGV